MIRMRWDDPLAIEVVDAIHKGDVRVVEQWLAADAGRATARIVDQRGAGRSLLHIVTDWPGHFPNNVAIAKLIVAHGADVNAQIEGGQHTEAPLHWAASSDDVEVLSTLLDLGANIEATGAVIGGGTPLADAVAFAQWNAARILVQRGAKANLWQAAGLGLLELVKSEFEIHNPSSEEVTKAFWVACHGGQRATAEYLLEHGANRNWIGYDHLTPIEAARRSGASELVEWLAKL